MDELLYVNGEGEVRWLIPTKEVEDIDLEKLEEYFSRCSSSNLQCFEYWMRETGLLDNPLAATMRKNLVEHLTVDLKNSDLYANYFTHAIDAVRLNFEIPNEEKENNFTLLRNRMLSVLASCLREASAIVRPPRDLPERLVRAVMLKKPYQLNPDSLEKRAKLLPGGKRSHIDFINAGIYHSKDIQTVNGKK